MLDLVPFDAPLPAAAARAKALKKAARGKTIQKIKPFRKLNSYTKSQNSPPSHSIIPSYGTKKIKKFALADFARLRWRPRNPQRSRR